MRLQLELMFCYTKPSVGPGPTTLLTFSSLQPLVAMLASWCSIAAHQRTGRAHETGDKFSQMEGYCGIFSYKPKMPPFPLLKTQEIVCMRKKNQATPSKAWEGRQCCCYFSNHRNTQPGGPDSTLRSAKELIYIGLLLNSSFFLPSCTLPFILLIKAWLS